MITYKHDGIVRLVLRENCFDLTSIEVRPERQYEFDGTTTDRAEVLNSMFVTLKNTTLLASWYWDPMQWYAPPFLDIFP